jgi:hypothetical protein
LKLPPKAQATVLGKVKGPKEPLTH